MELKPNISLSSGGLSKQRWAMNWNCNYCAIVLIYVHMYWGMHLCRDKSKIIKMCRLFGRILSIMQWIIMNLDNPNVYFLSICTLLSHSLLHYPHWGRPLNTFSWNICHHLNIVPKTEEIVQMNQFISSGVLINQRKQEVKGDVLLWMTLNGAHFLPQDSISHEVIRKDLCKVVYFRESCFGMQKRVNNSAF